MVVFLKKSTLFLEEIEIKSGENPANRIIRNTVKNRNNYNPENLSSFRFKAYNNLKFYVSFPPNFVDKDSSFTEINDKYLFLMESITEKTFLYPNKHKEKVIANKVSGFQSPPFAFFVSDLQPFGLYSDYLQLIDKKYLNPISVGTLGKYQFEIKDTHIVANDTLFIIQFEPQKGKYFQGLKGLLYINSSDYVVQNFIAEPAEYDKNSLVSKIKINHQYAKNKQNIWFPEQLNIYYDFPNKDLNSRNTRLLGESKTYIKDIEIDIDIEKSMFNEILVEFDKNANSRTDSVWSKYAYSDDIEKELKTYRFIDSLSKAQNLERKIKIAETLISGNIPVKFLNINLNKLMNINRYEGYRLGLGLTTNDKLTKYAEIGGYFAYGFKDKAFKYGTHARLKLNKRHKTYIEVSYVEDVFESAANKKPFHTFTGLTNDGKIRDYLIYMMDSTRKLKVETGSRLLKHFEYKAHFSQIVTNPTYNYTYSPTNSQVFNHKEIGFALRFAYNEKFIQSFGRYISVGTKYPIIQANYAEGIEGLKYQKFQLFIDDNILFRNIGQSTFRINSGFATRNVPYFLLYNGLGTFDAKNRIYTGFGFETMGFAEFISDRYLFLHYTHDFGSLLFNRKNFNPRLAIVYNGGIGNLDNKKSHNGISFKTMEKGYHETGILINNLLVSSISGIGIGCFYRMGAYSANNTIDNFVIKLTINTNIGF